MYTPRAFVETDLAKLDALFARDPFITLVTVGQGLPCVSHLPVLYSRHGEQVLLEGHWAKSNPQAHHAGPALAIVHGPQAYVSPGWYPDKETAARVPTWNYAVAHLQGPLQASDDPQVLASLVDRLSHEHESRVGSDWRFESGREDHVRQLSGIVAFQIPVQRIELKFKFNQNHPPANVRAVAQALQQQAAGHAHEVAALMLEALEKPHH